MQAARLLLFGAATLAGGCSDGQADAGSRPAAPAPAREPSAADADDCKLCEIYHQALGYVVRIDSGDNQGAGLIVSGGGIVVTNAHVVEGVTEVEVQTADGLDFVGQILALDLDLDLAVLRINAPGAAWFPVDLGFKDRTAVGSEVYVVGHPMGLGWTVSRGILSARRRPGEVAVAEMIQTDAAISPGNSGGPLLDGEGRLIGIVASKMLGPGSENLAFALPAPILLEYLAPYLSAATAD